MNFRDSSLSLNYTELCNGFMLDELVTLIFWHLYLQPWKVWLSIANGPVYHSCYQWYYPRLPATSDLNNLIFDHHPK